MEFSSQDKLLKCYRGQKNNEWENIPSLMIVDNINLLVNEREAIRRLITNQPQEFSTDLSMFDVLVRMQHFGMPTRLLDVSQNPLVALYFATEKIGSGDDKSGTVTCYAVPKSREKFYDSSTVSCLSNLSNLKPAEKWELGTVLGTTASADPSKMIEMFNGERVVNKLSSFIRRERGYFEPRIEPADLVFPQYVHAKKNNPRIVAQAGSFIIHGTQCIDIPYNDRIQEYKIIIPSEAKQKIRSELDLIGITESFLFPDLDRATSHVKNRYQ